MPTYKNVFTFPHRNLDVGPDANTTNKLQNKWTVIVIKLETGKNLDFLDKLFSHSEQGDSQDVKTAIQNIFLISLVPYSFSLSYMSSIIFLVFSFVR